MNQRPSVLITTRRVHSGGPWQADDVSALGSAVQRLCTLILQVGPNSSAWCSSVFVSWPVRGAPPPPQFCLRRGPSPELRASAPAEAFSKLARPWAPTWGPTLGPWHGLGQGRDVNLEDQTRPRAPARPLGRAVPSGHPPDPPYHTPTLDSKVEQTGPPRRSTGSPRTPHPGWATPGFGFCLGTPEVGLLGSGPGARGSCESDKR